MNRQRALAVFRGQIGVSWHHCRHFVPTLGERETPSVATRATPFRSGYQVPLATRTRIHLRELRDAGGNDRLTRSEVLVGL